MAQHNCKISGLSVIGAGLFWAGIMMVPAFAFGSGYEDACADSSTCQFLIEAVEVESTSARVGDGDEIDFSSPSFRSEIAVGMLDRSLAKCFRAGDGQLEVGVTVNLGGREDDSRLIVNSVSVEESSQNLSRSSIRCLEGPAFKMGLARRPFTFLDRPDGDDESWNVDWNFSVRPDVSECRYDTPTHRCGIQRSRSLSVSQVHDGPRDMDAFFENFGTYEKLDASFGNAVSMAGPHECIPAFEFADDETELKLGVDVEVTEIDPTEEEPYSYSTAATIDAFGDDRVTEEIGECITERLLGRLYLGSELLSQLFSDLDSENDESLRFRWNISFYNEPRCNCSLRPGGPR